ncbi:MAG: AraC family transcriptional regulator [Pigmentiphaga sp.]|nr:AraC family transcriptional regulator [Pigmentiphaga sp.]
MPDHLFSAAEHVLQSHLRFVSSDADEIRDRVTGALTDHRLEPLESALDSRLYGTLPHDGDDLQACVLEYGAAVSIRTAPTRDCLLVQIPLSGRVQVSCDEGYWDIRPGQGLILPSATPLDIHWARGASQLIVKIPLSRFERTCNSLTGRPLADAPLFRREIRLDEKAGMYCRGLIDYVCYQHGEAGAASPRFGVRAAEEALVSHLLLNYSSAVRDDRAPPRRALPRSLRLAREFIEARLREPISLADIADYAGVSVRSLSRAFQEQYEMSPMQAVRSLRLERIHDELRTARAGASVTEVALRWGYCHLGRFAAAYRERFGEAPSETLRRAG